ncbi:F-box protein [Cardamine amara subsp. amara]|uniref:F-box protein n=1 Tax=Cardamine amara subsp. amara TaxID=228776 RepID=A0ABD1A8X5_CARAN
MSSTMKKQKKHVSKEEDVHLTNGLQVNSRTLPTDLIVETLSRLPAKSIARFRCVSKNWGSFVSTPYFTNKFLAVSSARPRLLFTFQTEGKWSFFSSHQSLISDHNSSLLVVDKHMHVARDYSFGICVPACGFLCTKDEWISGGKRDSRMTICNPSTGQFKYLPKVKTRRGQVITYIGYDPIENQVKVLCMTICEKPFKFKAEEHQVLTLGIGSLKWRMIECSLAHYPHNKEICISGVIYYVAVDYESRKTVIVGFDVRNEKFSFIINKATENLGFPSNLINYKGKLGAVYHNASGFIDGRATSLEIWVIDDTEEYKWSRHIHILPPIWRNLVGETKVYIVGMIGTNEVVFSPYVLSSPFYIFHLNVERNSIRKVEIHGIGPLRGQSIFTFINFVESVKLIM